MTTRKFLETMLLVLAIGWLLWLLSGLAIAAYVKWFAPPSASYQPIPNFTGLGAGLQFRQAINDRFSGIQPIAPTVVKLAFANLPTEQDRLE